MRMFAVASIAAAVPIAIPQCSHADGWIHPAGFIDVATLADVRHKRETQEWARKQLDSLDRGVQAWLDQPMERLEELLPKKKMQVYWLLMCPDCRTGLRFDPFNDQEGTCRSCGKTFPLTQRSTATAPDSHYAGTLYDGWGCFYLQNLARIAEQVALLHALGAERRYAEWSADVIRLYARYLPTLPVQGGGTQHVIWTYNMEGDSPILASLATAYELLRGVDGLFTAEDHATIQQKLLKHWTDSVFRVEEDNSLRHNNMFRFLSIVAQVGCALDDADYVDWAFGRRAYSPEKRPNHKSLAWLTDHNYLPDGGFWGLCTAYHLYALGPHCNALLLGSQLSKQMPDLFPPELYDETDPTHPRGRIVRRALKWFTSQAFPDLTMAPNGDMGGRVSLAVYAATAEIGYRHLGLDEVGCYPELREGKRGLIALLYGADTIEEKPQPYRSAFLSSGFVALKRATEDNQLYAGLNALIPGSTHGHGDRLSLVTYSRDRMLSGEKRTQYSDPEQRTYSGASYAHNTVTIDETSQIHGNYLKDDRVPHIETFVDLPTVQVAEAHGDQIYEQTSLYRRLLCQFDEYLVDIFRVQGGKTHDWFFHGVGEKPVVTVPLQARSDFEPALYVVRGEPGYEHGLTGEPFSATWRIPAEPEAYYPGRRRDVFSRVTLAGCPQQEVNLLSTFPDPGKHSLMVRHVDSDSPFIAVHEAYFEQPAATSVRTLAGTAPAAVEVRHADGSRRLIAHGPGTAGGELSVDGLLCVVHVGSKGRVLDVALVRGSSLRYRGLRVEVDPASTMSLEIGRDEVTAVSSPAIAYHTVEGKPVFSIGESAALRLRLPASLSPTGEEINTRIDLPGQTEDGPRLTTVPLRRGG